MIPVREMTSADEVYANIRRLRGVFYGPRRTVTTQVQATAEHTANEALVGSKTPSPQTGSDPGRVTIAAPPKRDEVSEWVDEHRDAWNELQANKALSPYARAMQIVVALAEEHGVKAADVFSASRTARIVVPRQKAMAAIYLEFPQWPLVKIGKFFGGRDHTTVLHAVKKLGVWKGEAA